MYTLQLKPKAHRINTWRNGSRDRTPGVLLPDGSFIKLSLNRVVSCSDAVMEANKELLSSDMVDIRRVSIDKPIEISATDILQVEIDITEEGNTSQDEHVNELVIAEEHVNEPATEHVNELDVQSEEPVAVKKKRRR
jgi:hypothetical protein